MFIVVGGKSERMREVPAYLYSGQSVLVEPVETRFGSMLIVDTGSEDRYRAEYVRDRINSGMFGAVLFESIEDAKAYINEAKQ
jgi:hypothetical protein